MKANSLTIISDGKLSSCEKLITLLYLKTEFQRFCVLELFINFSVVAPMLPFMENLVDVLKSKCVKNW